MFFCILSGFPAAAYAAYAAGRGYSGYPSFGLPYPTGNHLATLHHHHHHNHHPLTLLPYPLDLGVYSSGSVHALPLWTFLSGKKWVLKYAWNISLKKKLFAPSPFPFWPHLQDWLIVRYLITFSFRFFFLPLCDY